VALAPAQERPRAARLRRQSERPIAETEPELGLWPELGDVSPAVHPLAFRQRLADDPSLLHAVRSRVALGRA